MGRRCRRCSTLRSSRSGLPERRRAASPSSAASSTATPRQPAPIQVEWIQDGLAHNFDALHRSAAARDAARAFVGSFAKTGEQRQLLDACSNASDEVGRPFVMSKQVPPRRIRDHSQGIAGPCRTRTSSPTWRKQQMPVDSITGDDDRGQMMNAPPAKVVAKAKAIFGNALSWFPFPLGRAVRLRTRKQLETPLDCICFPTLEFERPKSPDQGSVACRFPCPRPPFRLSRSDQRCRGSRQGASATAAEKIDPRAIFFATRLAPDMFALTRGPDPRPISPRTAWPGWPVSSRVEDRRRRPSISSSNGSQRPWPLSRPSTLPRSMPPATRSPFRSARTTRAWQEGDDYLNHFVLPNVYFHMTAAYAIPAPLRRGDRQRDFLGAIPMKMTRRGRELLGCG